jgi:hypothetical protein
MLLQNLSLEQLNVKKVKSDILQQYQIVELESEAEIENMLAELYQQASLATESLYYSATENLKSAKSAAFSTAKAGRNIFKKIKEYICKFLTDGSTVDDILDVILEALSAIIPGGVIIEKLIAKLLKFIVHKGIDAFCGVTPA